MNPEEMAAEAMSTADIEAEIGRYLKLSHLERARTRKAVAKKIGISAADLDTEVMARLKQREDGASGPLFEHWGVEPWPEPVDSGELLAAVTERIQNHVILTGHEILATSLWTMFTWVHDVAVHSPLLLVTSPERECGKSTLFGVLGYLVKHSMLTVHISGPALFRSIEKWHPTFVLDEADEAFSKNGDLREVVNSGWTRGQSVIRCNPTTFEPEAYSTFSPKAIGLKGRKLPDTTLSRAVIIELRRKRPGERVADFAHGDDPALAELRRKLLRWADDNAAELAGAEATIPEGFHNRVRANWTLVLAIAELAGAGKEAREAAVEIEKVKTAFEASYGVELLQDIRGIFGDKAAIFTKALLDELAADAERPWAAYGKSHKPITDRQLAKLLGAYQIVSTTVRIGEVVSKGYRWCDFDDAFARYLPETPAPIGHPPSSRYSATTPLPQALPTVPRVTTSVTEGYEGYNGGAACDVTEADCNAQSNPQGFKKPNNGGHCNAVTPGRSGDYTRERVCAQCGAGDGPMHGNYGVPLHALCVRFYLNEHPDAVLVEDGDAPF